MFLRMRRTLSALLFTLAGHAVPATLTAQGTQDYVVAGPTVWSTAKTYGFTFQPLASSSSQTVTNPRDGVDTRLRTTQKNLLGVTETITLAQVTGGNASVNRPPSGSRTATFRFFGDRLLSPGWTVVKVELTGNYVWDRQAAVGSRDLSFQVKATSTTSTTGNAIIKAVTLRGPAGANWADAFAERKLFTVNGIEAWNVAKLHGFTFQPLLDGIIGTNPTVTTPHDGVATRLLIAKEQYTNCEPYSPNTYGFYSTCLVAEVVGGTMVVYKPGFHTVSYSWNNPVTVRFALFQDKRLASGWTVQRVDVSNGTWITRPAAGGDDLSLVLQLTSGASTGANAHVRSIVLEGPGSASGWQDAFRGALSP